MQTSNEHIYAVGDAIEFRHPLTDRPWLNYLAGPANRQSRIVADNMDFGNQVTYEVAVGTSIAKIFDMTVAASGLPAKRLKPVSYTHLDEIQLAGSGGITDGGGQGAFYAVHSPVATDFHLGRNCK